MICEGTELIGSGIDLRSEAVEEKRIEKRKE